MLQKVALVTSALGDEALTQAGVPAVGRASLEELGAQKGVSYAVAARSFDPALVGRMTEELVCEGGAEGARLFMTPDLKSAADPYGRGLSEDPYLNGVLGAEIVSGVHRAGAAAGLARLSVTDGDVALLDRRENAGAVHELFVKPFLQASAKESCEAVFLTPAKGGSGYRDTNAALFSDVTNGYFGDVFAVCDGTPSTAEALSMLRGRVTLGGAAIPLERAARRYVRLAAYREEGSITARDLEDAVREGSALETEKLDGAADEVADFAVRVSGLTPNEPFGDEARRKLAADCIVLLKNSGLLPLTRKTKIAVVGEAYADLSALGETFEIVGTARGYDRTEERSDTLIPDAVRATDRAEAVLVFLYPDGGGRSLSLPANRLALLDALGRTGKRIVALVCGDMPADLSFDRTLDATLLLPADGPFAGEALARVLSGEVNPSGRLARTAYDGADAYFRTLKQNKDSGRIRIGSLCGYRRYDTAGEGVRYPFGFGLSYTRFVYSKLTVEGDAVSFTLENAGRADGTETVQIYIGAQTDTRVAPKKELKAILKISLAAGQKKRVTVKLPVERYASFDPRTFADNVEAGTYRIYVCASALDVRLQGKRTLEGTKREAADERLTDYFPDFAYNAVSDVRREDRLGNNEAGNVPKALLIARKAAIFIAPAAAAVLLLLMTILVFSYALDYSLQFAFNDEVAKWAVFGLAVVILALIPLLGSLNRKRLSRVFTVSVAACPVLLIACLIVGILILYDNGGEAEETALIVISCFAISAPLCAVLSAIAEHTLKKSKSGVNRWQKFYFEHEYEEQCTPEAVFEEAFRAEEAARAAEAARKEAPPPPPAAPQFYDKTLTYPELMRDCGQFARERGTVIPEETLREWLAALTSTQLIVVPAAGGKGAAVCCAVAEYFGRKAFVDNAAQYGRSDDLFTQWKQIERVYVRTEFSAAVAAAKRDAAFLHTVLIRHVDPARLAELFAPVAAVVSRRKTAVTLSSGEEIALPPNLRIVVETEGDERLPLAIAEAAAYLSPACEEGEPYPRKSIVQSVGYEQFAALKQTVRDEYPLGEEAWKGVDRLDGRCRSAHIGNLLWVKTELHASVALACGCAENDALDGALAAELIPWLTKAWDETLCGGALPDVFIECFGRDPTAARRTAGDSGKKKDSGRDQIK